MNFLPCEITSVEGDLHRMKLIDGREIEFLSGYRFPTGHGSLYTIRPENITVTAEPHSNGHNFVTGVLKHKIYMGDYYEFEFDLGNGIIFRVQANKAGDNSWFHSFSQGGEYYLSWEKTAGWPVVE